MTLPILIIQNARRDVHRFHSSNTLKGINATKIKGFKQSLVQIYSHAQIYDWTSVSHVIRDEEQ